MSLKINLNKRSLFLLIVVGVVVFFCSTINALELQKQRYRPYTPVTISTRLKNEIKTNTSGLTPYDIAIYCKEKTQDLLTFSPICESFDDSRITKMHCVGYARVYATICNYAFKVNGVKGTVKPVVGIVKQNGFNLNTLSNLLPGLLHDFTKDHDFAEVKYDNKILYVDPSLNIVNVIK